MSSSKSQRLLFVLSFLVLVSTYLPVVFANLPPVIKSHHLYIGLWFMALLLFKPGILRDGFFVLTLMYGLIMTILLRTVYESVDKDFSGPLVNEFYAIIVPVSILRYYIVHRDFIGLAKLTKYTL